MIFFPSGSHVLFSQLTLSSYVYVCGPEELRAPSRRPQSDKMPSHPHHHPPINTKKEILDISDLMHFISGSEFVCPPNSLLTSYNPCHPTSYNPCRHIISNLPIAGFSAKIVINLVDQANNGMNTPPFIEILLMV